MTEASVQDSEIARAVLHYLQEHPDARDTLEGIAQWWLLIEWTERKVDEVQRAVDVLLEKELIVVTRREGAPPYYRLNRKKTKDISRILKRK